MRVSNEFTATCCESSAATAVSLQYIRPRQVAYVRAHGAYATASRRAWGIMLDWLDSRGLAARVPCGYGLAHDNPNQVVEPLCRYDACVELPPDFVENLADGVAFQTLPGGAFARYRHVGSYSALSRSVEVVRDKWLSLQDHLMLDRRRPFLFEYLNDPRAVEPSQVQTNVCLPVRAPVEETLPRLRYSIGVAASC